MPDLLLQTALPPSNLPYLFAAFAVTWLVFFGYMFFIGRRQQEIRTEIDRLRRAVDRADADGNGGGEIS